MRLALSALLIVTGLYVICLVALTLAQRSLMYFPCRTSQSDLEAAAKTVGFKPWVDSAGQVIGWYRPNQPTSAARCILVLHGNAGCAPDRFHYADAFQAIEPIDFYILEYPGYGGRPGSPSQTTILRAAEEALTNIPEYCSVFLVAESLGTGPAAWLAGKYRDRIGGLLLIAPYNTMTAVAQNHLPLFPVRAMLRDRYPSTTWLAQYSGPVAVLLAGRDQVVPPQFGRALYDSYPGPKKLWTEPYAGHNEVHNPQPGFWKELIEFWNQNSR